MPNWSAEEFKKNEEKKNATKFLYRFLIALPSRLHLFISIKKKSSAVAAAAAPKETSKLRINIVQSSLTKIGE